MSSFSSLLMRFSVTALTVVIGCGGGDDAGDSSPASPFSPPTIAPEQAPVTAQCAGVTRASSLVASRLALAHTPPALGGDLVVGTYDLTDLIVYDPTRADEVRGDDDPPLPDGKETAQTTLVVAKDHLRYAAGVGEVGESKFASEQLSAGWFKTEGTEIVYDEICPTRQSQRIPFTALAAGLVLYPRPNRVESYTLRP